MEAFPSTHKNLNLFFLYFNIDEKALGSGREEEDLKESTLTESGSGMAANFLNQLYLRHKLCERADTI